MSICVSIKYSIGLYGTPTVVTHTNYIRASIATCVVVAYDVIGSVDVTDMRHQPTTATPLSTHTINLPATLISIVISLRAITVKAWRLCLWW